MISKHAAASSSSAGVAAAIARGETATVTENTSRDTNLCQLLHAKLEDFCCSLASSNPVLFLTASTSVASIALRHSDKLSYKASTITKSAQHVKHACLSAVATSWCLMGLMCFILPYPLPTSSSLPHPSSPPHPPLLIFVRPSIVLCLLSSFSLSLSLFPSLSLSLYLSISLSLSLSFSL